MDYNKEYRAVINRYEDLMSGDLEDGYSYNYVVDHKQQGSLEGFVVKSKKKIPDGRLSLSVVDEASSYNAEVFDFSSTPIRYFKGIPSEHSEFDFRGNESMKILSVGLIEDPGESDYSLLKTSPTRKDKSLFRYDLAAFMKYGFCYNKF